MDIENFPYLNRGEFSEACHHLENQYCQATLGPLRARWKLRLCTALDAMFSVDGLRTTYIQIVRPLDLATDHGDLSLDLTRFSFSEHKVDNSLPSADDIMLDDEESDSLAISKHKTATDVSTVTYEIHLHPTYRVPCLWFTLQGLPAGEPAFNIDTVLRRLVPDEYKDGLRSAGRLGGISADHHPITGVPSFFLHPCQVGEAISSFQCSRQNYLMVWLGLVGGCVSLWVPTEMASVGTS